MKIKNKINNKMNRMKNVKYNNQFNIKQKYKKVQISILRKIRMVKYKIIN